jgi:hypothetical protein
MHSFISPAIGSYLTFGLVIIIPSLLAIGMLLLFTAKDSKLRKWLLATNQRIELMGFALLVFVWLGFFIYNRVTNS